MQDEFSHCGLRGKEGVRRFRWGVFETSPGQRFSVPYSSAGSTSPEAPQLFTSYPTVLEPASSSNVLQSPPYDLLDADCHRRFLNGQKFTPCEKKTAWGYGSEKIICRCSERKSHYPALEFTFLDRWSNIPRKPDSSLSSVIVSNNWRNPYRFVEFTP